MNKQQAQNIIKNTFENSFDINNFTGFIKNLLNTIDEDSFTYQGNNITDAYKQYIKKLERIGKFSDGDKSIDILAVTLQKETSLERARTMQRNFIAWYLNGNRGGTLKDAALVAFVSPHEGDWRFSLVKMDYNFEQTKTGKMKVKEEFTPARRWSFLVGKNENSHTAQSRLVNILANDEQAPTLEELEIAFDIETVTKEFFLKYRELFIRTKEELDKVIKRDPKIKADFEAKGVDTVNFAKKLLGQIVFLYFLQKKGWFGVGRDNDWGTGSKNFLRELFCKKYGDYKNFFNDILEPLFYEALRIDRSYDDDYYSRFNCKIPFLNGGLFDPIGNYDWVHTDIIIPDSLFSNKIQTKEGDEGNGILDIFDRYNFTVKEDEPLEKEVAIDPELLGKAYEKFNAIRLDNYTEFKKALKSGKKGDESKFNKKYGVYYTPREIVHYMCQQSLINYLATEMEDSVGKKDIEILIHVGEHVSENEARVLRKGRETKDYYYQLPESIRKNAKLIDDKLADITVCDPAVGSGAFPVGMMSEVVRTRNVLSTFVKDKNRTPYEFKRCCIEHSLYGVDIDPGAVEIAKLRMWLSLVVDENDIRNIKPLPNLDYRIMQGNSLISEFMGIHFDTGKENSKNVMFKDETDELIEHFQQKKDVFLNESNVTRKTQLKEDIDNLLVKIFEAKIKNQKEDYFSKLKRIENKYSVLPNKDQRDEYIKQDKVKLYKESGFDLESTEKQLKEFTSGKKIKPFFLWNLYFSEVFLNRGGFDVLIANPPYVGQSSNKDIFREVLRTPFGKRFHQRRMDYFYFFYHRGIELTRNVTGIIAFITTNYFFNATYADKLRTHIFENCRFITLINFNECKIFENATGQHNTICIMTKNIHYNGAIAALKTNRKDLITNNTIRMILEGSDNETEYYSYSNIEVFDGPKHYIRTEGCFNAGSFADRPFNSIFLKMHGNNPSLGQVAEIYQGIVTGANVLTQNQKMKYSINVEEGSGIFIAYDYELDKLNLTQKENNFIKPWYKNSDIERWVCSAKTERRIIYLTSKDDISDMYIPNLIKHFRPYKSLLINRNVRTGSFSDEQYNMFVDGKIDIPYVMIKSTFKSGRYFCLSYARDKFIFESNKIVCPQRSPVNTFAYSDQPWYAASDVYYLLHKEGSNFPLKYLLSLLNSKLYYFWLYFKGQRKGQTLQLFKDPLSEIPVKRIPDENSKKFISEVDKILSITKSEDYQNNESKQAEVKKYEEQIDQMVYELYGLTKEEIAIVEGKENESA